MLTLSAASPTTLAREPASWTQLRVDKSAVSKTRGSSILGSTVWRIDACHTLIILCNLAQLMRRTCAPLPYVVGMEYGRVTKVPISNSRTTTTWRWRSGPNTYELIRIRGRQLLVLEFMKLTTSIAANRLQRSVVVYAVQGSCLTHSPGRGRNSVSNTTNLAHCVLYDCSEIGMRTT